MEVSSAAPAASVPAERRFLERLGAYVALTKPRIIELLLVTTVPTMIVAERGLPPVWLMVATVIGGTLAAGGAIAIISINRVRKKSEDKDYAHFYGTVLFYTVLVFSVGGQVILPLMAYMR